MRRLVDSLGAAVVGYLVAVAAAGFSYMFLLAAAVQIGGHIAEPSEMSALQQLNQLIWFAVMASLLIGVVAFIPFAAAIAVMIMVGRTDLISCIIAAVAVGVSSVAVARRNVIFMDRLEVSWLIVAAAIVAGAAFWAVFSRMAPQKAATP